MFVRLEVNITGKFNFDRDLPKDIVKKFVLLDKLLTDQMAINKLVAKLNRRYPNYTFIVKEVHEVDADQCRSKRVYNKKVDHMLDEFRVMSEYDIRDEMNYLCGDKIPQIIAKEYNRNKNTLFGI